VNTHLRILLFIHFFIYISIKSNAIPYAITNSNTSHSIPADKYVYYLEDRNNSVTIDSLLNNSLHYQFKKAKKTNLNYGFYNCTIWLKLSIDNQTTLNKDFLFSIDYALLNEVTFYESINGKLLRCTETGENKPFFERDIIDKNFIFHLNNYPLQFKTYFIRIYNNGEPLRIPMRINSPVYDKEAQGNLILSVAIYYGYLLFSIFLNILLFLSFRKRQYLYFGGFVLFFALFIFIGDGFAFQYFWPDFPWFANHSIIAATALTNFCMLAFARDFHNYTGRIKHYSNYFYALFLAFFILAFIGYPTYRYIVMAANIITFVTIIFIVITSAHYLRKQNSAYNKVFLLAFFFVTTGTIIYILRNAGLIPVNYLTQYAIKLGFVLQIVVLTFALIIKFKIDLTNVNIKLERDVEDRTAEIRAQHDKLSEHNTRIEMQSKEITDSIIYAKRIQSAILPERHKFSYYFKEHLILFKPKQIVSGDFYWFAEKNGKVYIAVADCTGHGVPGGFLSMLGISFLNEIINKDAVLPPHRILNELQKLILSTLSAKSEDGMANRDGMDISLCSIDFVNNKIEFSGANNPIFLIRNNEINEFKVDKMPIGQHVRNDKLFTHHEFPLQEGDRIYLLSDGFFDQFNIESKKRFTKSKFKNLLLDIHQKPFDQQHIHLEKTLEKWKGETEQIDDILVMGLLV